MKTELTTEQSQHLIELGVPREKASKHNFRKESIFTLTDLLEILPKENKELHIIFGYNN